MKIVIDNMENNGRNITDKSFYYRTETGHFVESKDAVRSNNQVYAYGLLDCCLGVCLVARKVKNGYNCKAYYKFAGQNEKVRTIPFKVSDKRCNLKSVHVVTFMQHQHIFIELYVTDSDNNNILVASIPVDRQHDILVGYAVARDAKTGLLTKKIQAVDIDLGTLI